MIRCEGIPFESESEAQIYARFHQLALLLAGLGKTLGNRLGLWTTLQRKKDGLIVTTILKICFAKSLHRSICSGLRQGSFSIRIFI